MRVRVSAPSHVHLGNPDLNGATGRLYGTLGFTLLEPRAEIEATLGEGRCEGCRSDLEELMHRLQEVFECRINVRVKREIPAHVGLGSTTSLYLGLAHSYSLLCGRQMSVKDMARLTGRGRISALGVYSYIHGGFIVDGGFRLDDKRDIPPLIFNARIPENLRFVVALPASPIERILRIKEREDQILETLPRMEERMAEYLSRIVLMGIIPYAAEGDWESAGRYATLFNRALGEYWGEKQGGIYCCRESESLIRLMEENGALLVAQSSWGPTVYGLVEEKRAPEILAKVERALRDLGGGQAWVTPPDNRGARVSLEW